MDGKKLTDSEITIKALKELLEVMLCEGDLQRVSTISHTIEYINRLQAENERFKNSWEADVVSAIISGAKAEAYKEFAERLKKNITDMYNYYEEQEYPRARITDIDNLLKELVGEGNA